MLLCLVLALSSCTSVDHHPVNGGLDPIATPTPVSPTPTVATVLAPLTGVPTTAAIAAQPTVAIPISVDGRRPPAGLGSADIVYAELDGVSRIRLLGLFQSHDSTVVGPVDGLGPVIDKLLPVVGPVVAAGQTYPKFSQAAATAGLNVISVSSHPSAFRQSGGAAYASTIALRALARHGSRPPPGLFSIAGHGEPLVDSGLQSVTHLRMPTIGSPVFSWNWDPALGRWRGTVGKAAVSAANIVVLAMPYKTLCVKCPQGPNISTATVYGGGNGYVVSGPHGANGHWARKGPLKLATIATTTGVSLRLAPGPTWVIMLPIGMALAAT